MIFSPRTSAVIYSKAVTTCPTLSRDIGGLSTTTIWLKSLLNVLYFQLLLTELPGGETLVLPCIIPREILIDTVSLDPTKRFHTSSVFFDKKSNKKPWSYVTQHSHSIKRKENRLTVKLTPQFMAVLSSGALTCVLRNIDWTWKCRRTTSRCFLSYECQ